MNHLYSLLVRSSLARVRTGAAAGTPASFSRFSRFSSKTSAHAFPEFKLTFIGTGGSNPSRFRGSSCTVLDLGGESWVFDAGEGSMPRMPGNTSIAETSRIFITHMHADHILGLPSLVLSAGMVTPLTNPTKPSNNNNNLDSAVVGVPDPHAFPLKIYGPPGLHKYLSTVISLTQSKMVREVIVHELMYEKEDEVEMMRTSFNEYSQMFKNTSRKNNSGWRKVGDQKDDTGPLNLSGGKSIKKKELHSINGKWICVDESTDNNIGVTVEAKLILHSIPCWGYVVQEYDIAGKLMVDKCDALKVAKTDRKLLKNGKDVIAEDGSTVTSADVCEVSIKGRKVTILGDTFNATNIVDIAQESDVLVHESSYEQKLMETAVARGHSTPRMAAKMGLMTKAKRLVLNHVGSRYIPQTRVSSSLSANLNLFDTALQKEGRIAFGRPQHLIIARDRISVSIPVGGYNINDNSFKVSIDGESSSYEGGGHNHKINKIEELTETAPNATFRKGQLTYTDYPRKGNGNGNDKSNLNNPNDKDKDKNAKSNIVREVFHRNMVGR